MENIYRYIVKEYGEEEYAFEGMGKVLFINCPFKKSQKIFSYRWWSFSERGYKKKLAQYNIMPPDFREHQALKILMYRVLVNIEKYDCICIGMAGFAFNGMYSTKLFLMQLKSHLRKSKIFVIVEEEILKIEDVFSEFPIWVGNV